MENISLANFIKIMEEFQLAFHTIHSDNLYHSMDIRYIYPNMGAQKEELAQRIVEICL